MENDMVDYLNDLENADVLDGLDKLIDETDDIDLLKDIKNFIESVNESESEDSDSSESIKVLTRELSENDLNNRIRDTEEVLQNYADNLRDHGVRDENSINEFIDSEREKINLYYENLDKGKPSEAIYYEPQNWEQIANELGNDSSSGKYTEDEIQSEMFSEFDQQGLLRESLEEDYNDDFSEDDEYDDKSERYLNIPDEDIKNTVNSVDLENEMEKLDVILDDFQRDNWEDYNIDQQKCSISNLAEELIEKIGFNEPPKIEYYNLPEFGDYGFFDGNKNTLSINEYMMSDSEETADTVAHELWHAHQMEIADNALSDKSEDYAANFEFYIPPELCFDAYQDQLIEAEARAFADRIKTRIKGGNKE